MTHDDALSLNLDLFAGDTEVTITVKPRNAEQGKAVVIKLNPQQAKRIAERLYRMGVGAEYNQELKEGLSNENLLH